MADEKNILFASAATKSANRKGRTYGSTSKSASTTTPKTQLHKVRPSDTLVSLAIKYESTVEELKRLNSLWSNESLQLKSSIKVPIVGSAASAAAASPRVATPTEAVSLEQFVSEEDDPQSRAAAPVAASSGGSSGSGRPHNSKGAISRSKTFAAASDKDFSEMDSNEFLRKFDLQFMQLKTNVEKMENESSLSEEDSAYNCMPRRSARYMRRQAFRSSEQMVDGPDVLTNPELVVRSKQLPEAEDSFYKL